MIKKRVLVALFFSFSVWADNDRSDGHEINKHVEDEELIGGIGGTGLHDMERPELLERPEIDLDSVLESAEDNDIDMTPEVDTARPE